MSVAVAPRRRRALVASAVFTGVAGIAVIAGVAGIGLAGCGGERAADRPSRPPDVIVISLDTLRRDRVGLFSGAAAKMPHLERFGREAVVFDDASTAIPFTLSSHMTMMTGLYPDVHRVLSEHDALRDGIPTMATALAGAGYRTLGLVSNVWMESHFGFDRGFEKYERIAYGLEYLPRLRARLGELLDAPDPPDAPDAKDERPLFLFLHALDPHSDFDDVTKSTLPYWSPERYRAALGVAADSDRFCLAGECATRWLLAFNKSLAPLPAADRGLVEALYDAGVAGVDAELGLLFAELDRRSRFRDALVVVLSDHGEEFREHGRFLHDQLFRECLEVPLLIRFPRAAHAGTMVRDPVETVDLLPTVLEASGVAPPADLQGESLLRLLAPLAPMPPGTKRPEAQFYVDRFRPHRFGIRRGPSKLLFDFASGAAELYRLDRDPGETRDAKGDPDAGYAALVEALKARVRENRRLATKLKSRDASQPMSAEEVEELRSIGYL